MFQGYIVIAKLVTDLHSYISMIEACLEKNSKVNAIWKREKKQEFHRSCSDDHCLPKPPSEKKDLSPLVDPSN